MHILSFDFFIVNKNNIKNKANTFFTKIKSYLKDFCSI